MNMRRGIRVGIVVLLLVGVGLVYLVTVVNPVVEHYAIAQLDALTVQAVNLGVGEVVDANTYSQLTDIRRDQQGVITSISADVVAMNRLAALVSQKAQTHLAALGQVGIPVPLGTYSGIPLLVGKGRPLMLKLTLIGAINCRFDSALASAGINQTQHKIMLYVDAVVDVILPLSHQRTNVAIQMLFADSVIVGPVPNFMFPPYNNVASSF